MVWLRYKYSKPQNDKKRRGRSGKEKVSGGNNEGKRERVISVNNKMHGKAPPLPPNTFYQFFGLFSSE
jgi:hypothetical protein